MLTTESYLRDLEKEYQKSTLRDERFELTKALYAYLENQLKKEPKNIQVLIQLGVLSWEPFHRQEEAITYLERAIEYDPKTTEARFWLAKCYYHDYCDYARVEAILLEALSIDPKKPECLSLLASDIIDIRGDVAKALSCFEEAIDYAPDWPILRYSAAQFYLDKKDVASAKSQIDYVFNHCTPLLQKPKNFIERYWENAVTGRSWSDMKEEFKDLTNPTCSLSCLRS